MQLDLQSLHHSELLLRGATESLIIIRVINDRIMKYQ